MEAHCLSRNPRCADLEGIEYYKDQGWMLILFPTFKSALSFLLSLFLSLSFPPPFTTLC